MRCIEVDLPKEWDFCELLVLADVHTGDPFCTFEALHRMVAWVGKDERRLVVLNGDLIDNAIRESVGDPYEATMSPQAQKHAVEDILKPIASRIKAVTTGNHEERTYKHGGADASEDIARYLDVPYAREAVFLSVALGWNAHTKQRTIHTVYVTHGWAGGRTPGASINAAVDLEHTVDADLYVVGHSHKPGIHYKNFFRPRANQHDVEEVLHTFVSGGSLVAWGGYGTRKGLPPTSRRMPYVWLDGKQRQSEVRWIF